MWLFLNNAFLSIVDPPAKDDLSTDLLVRARIKGDIERVFPSAKVEETPRRDYRFRALIPRNRVANAVREAVLNLDYPNFKNSVGEDARHDAYSSVWGVMFRLQHALGGRTIAEMEAEKPRPLFDLDEIEHYGQDWPEVEL